MGFAVTAFFGNKAINLIRSSYWVFFLKQNHKLFVKLIICYTKMTGRFHRCHALSPERGPCAERLSLLYCVQGHRSQSVPFTWGELGQPPFSHQCGVLLQIGWRGCGFQSLLGLGWFLKQKHLPEKGSFSQCSQVPARPGNQGPGTECSHQQMAHPIVLAGMQVETSRSAG